MHNYPYIDTPGTYTIADVEVVVSYDPDYDRQLWASYTLPEGSTIHDPENETIRDYLGWENASWTKHPTGRFQMSANW